MLMLEDTTLRRRHHGFIFLIQLTRILSFVLYIYIAICGGIKSQAESLTFSYVQLVAQNKYSAAILKIVDYVEMYEI
jgi:hypothetical protein